MNTETEKFLDDVLITAIEGGIGYWSVCHSYRHNDGQGPVTAEIEELEDDGVTGANVKFTLNREMVDAAMRKCLAERLLNRDVLGAIITEDAGALDANDADCIVQIGCYGKVVFG